MPEQLVKEAKAQGIETLALTDDWRLSGIVPFLKACQQYGIKGLVGAEVVLETWGKLVLLVPDTAAYGDLTALLSEAHLNYPRSHPMVTWEMLQRWGKSLIGLTGDREGVLAKNYPLGNRQRLAQIAQQLYQVFGSDRLFIEWAVSLLPGDRQIFHALSELGECYGWKTITTGAVHYAQKSQFGLLDVMTCIRLGKRIEEVFPGRRLNAENYLKPWSVFEKLFRDRPEILTNTLSLAERLEAPQLFHRKFRPLYRTPNNENADQYLQHKVLKGAQWRYQSEAPKVRDRIIRELSVIRDLGFSDYFLVVADIADYARKEKIRFSGRGSAADSVVAYCLGITDVDAWRRNLLFERFMSRERQEMPDIDIDFDARYRDQVEEYVKMCYGASHVARVATYQTYRQRLAVREIGKVMGFPPQELDALAKSLPELSIAELLDRWDNIPELSQFMESDRLKLVLTWATALEGIPRHMGTHLGGVVISHDPLAMVSPRERSPKGIEILQFDKRDVEDLGLVKLDLLSLRTFSAVEMASQAIRATDSFDYDQIPLKDQATFERLQRGESIGVFQLESPAQRSLAQRLEPDTWEDIVASLALIRPGPIKGNMVEPFIARRRGVEPVTYLHPDLEPILAKTYGVVLFQEQVIAIASTLAGFTHGEADLLRRVMTHARSTREMEELGRRFREKAVARGVSDAIAEQVFQQIVGYASYGFNEAHAAAFAETSYRTAYLLEHFPRQYFLGLLNAEPLGYYPIDVLIVEARRRGIKIYPIDINVSGIGVVEEGADGLRIGLGFVKGVGQLLAQRVVEHRPRTGYRHPEDVMDSIPDMRPHMRRFIEIGAFDSITLDRTGLLTDVQGENRLRLTVAKSGNEWSQAEKIVADYRYLGFGQHQQWMELWRPHVKREGFLAIQEIETVSIGQSVRTVALFYRPHRPPTRSGQLVVFFSLVDETGVLEARLSSKGYQRFGHLLFGKVRRIIAVAGVREASGLRVQAIAPWPQNH